MNEKASIYGTRCFTAYLFYGALVEKVKQPKGHNDNSKKATLAATKNVTIYCAADEKDATDNTKPGDIVVILNRDRDNTWSNCKTISGCRSMYEFMNTPHSGDSHTLRCRYLPCPCDPCLIGQYDQCQLVNIVGCMQRNIMKLVPSVSINGNSTTEEENEAVNALLNLTNTF